MMIRKLYKKLQLVRVVSFKLITRLRVVRARQEGRKIIFLLGVPEHNNIGDLAIAEAEKRFIKTYVGDTLTIPVPFVVLSYGIDFLKDIANDRDVIAGHGGGNMGDTYLYEEEMRRQIIDMFSSNKIIIFPQTMYFSNTPSGQAELKKTQYAYAKHKKLTLIARERVSYDAMVRAFPDNEVILTPDIVLSMNVPYSTRERRGAVTCIRRDVESRLDEAHKIMLRETLSKSYQALKVTDTTEPGWLYRLKPNKYIVWKKLRQFMQAEVVVTDRLHGMVFCAITGTPCVAMTNFNHKVLGTYEWIKHLEYIKYCESIEDIKNIDMRDLASKAHAYNPSQFDEYWVIIRNLIVGDDLVRK